MFIQQGLQMSVVKGWMSAMQKKFGIAFSLRTLALAPLRR
jgi:hypothetical protein